VSGALSPALLEGVRAVSFDLDGTLYELPGMRRAVRRLALRRAWRPWRTWSELRILLQARAEFQRVREAGGDLAAESSLREGQARRSELEARWWIPAIAEVGPRPGLVSLLDALAQRGLPLVVCSDHAGQAKLAALGLEGHFEAALAGEALGALKPDPRVLQAALDRLDLEPGALLHIGDREDTDGEAARALGARVWIVPAEGPISLAD
jgi:putative hydrolase of the HAD superfamily